MRLRRLRPSAGLASIKLVPQVGQQFASTLSTPRMRHPHPLSRGLSRRRWPPLRSRGISRRHWPPVSSRGLSRRHWHYNSIPGGANCLHLPSRWGAMCTCTPAGRNCVPMRRVILHYNAIPGGANCWPSISSPRPATCSPRPAIPRSICSPTPAIFSPRSICSPRPAISSPMPAISSPRPGPSRGNGLR